MPTSVSDMGVLREYLDGVTGRAEHHALNVNGIIYTLVGVLIQFSDPETPPQAHNGHNGGLANTLWFTRHGRKYALSYDPQQKNVALKDGGVRGSVIARFDNTIPVAAIRRTFEALR